MLLLLFASCNKLLEVPTELKRTAMNSNLLVMMFSEFKKSIGNPCCGTSKDLFFSSLPPFLEILRKTGEEENGITN